MSEMRARIKLRWVLGVCLLVMVPVFPKRTHKAPPPPPSNYKPVNAFDPARDPAKDLKDAIAVATQSKRRILLEVGGDWCMWDQIMDRVFEDHPKLRELRDSHYVRVKIYYAKDNPNTEFLSHYPSIPDYPHFFVLDSSGTLFHSQRTKPFEQKKTYNVGKITAFLKKWEPESWWGRNPDPPEALGKSQH